MRFAVIRRTEFVSFSAVLIFLAPSATPTAAPADSGIAARYPGDKNIQSDPAVLFFDDFESYGTASQLTTRWNNVFQLNNTRIATEPGNFYGGGKALEFKLPQTTVEIANAVVKNISTPADTLFARVYTKFDPLYDIAGSNHNGIRLSSKFNAGPGIPANGTNFFLVLLQNNEFPTDAPAPGYSQLYVYHPEQRSQWGDIWLPTGMVLPNGSLPYDFGPSFVKRPNFVPQRGRWYCYELKGHLRPSPTPIPAETTPLTSTSVSTPGTG